MATGSVFVLVPTAITEAMLTFCDITEPAAGEVAWVSGVAYSVGDVRIRTQTHKVYECVQAVPASRTTVPESDPAYWLEKGPTLRWAVFDDVVMTASTAVGSFTYKVQPGFFNAIGIYGLDGGTVSVTGRDAPGGNVYFTYQVTPQAVPLDEYEYYFGAIIPLSKVLLSGLLPFPTAEVTITVSAAAGVTVSAGKFVFGDMQKLLDDSASSFGGTRHGATVEPTSFSYVKINDDGSARIKRRGATTGMHIEVVMPKGGGDRALELVQRLLDIGAVWVGSTAVNKAGLNVFGLGSAKVSYEEEHDVLIIDVKGLG